MPNKTLDLYDPGDPDYMLDYNPQETSETTKIPQGNSPQDWDDLGFVNPKVRFNLENPPKYKSRAVPFLTDSPEHSIQDVWRIDVDGDVLNYLNDLRSKDCTSLYLKYVAVLKKLASQKVPPLKVTQSKEPILYLYCKSVSLEELLKACFNHRENIEYIADLSNYLFIGFNTLDAPNRIRGEYAWMLHSTLDLNNKDDQKLYRSLTPRTPVHLIHKICELGIDRIFAEDLINSSRDIDLPSLTARAYDAIRYAPAKLKASSKASTPKSSQDIKGKKKFNRKERSLQRKENREAQPPKKKVNGNNVTINSLFSNQSKCNQPAKQSWPKTLENKQMIKNVS